jgi:hypothetical protein
VWVGAGTQSGGGGVSTNGCNGRVCVAPAPPTNSQPVMIQFYPAGGPLASAGAVNIHLGWNGWNPVVSPDATMTLNAASNRWEYTVPIPVSATQLDCVFNDGSGTWDNNSGQDWHFTVAANSSPQPPPTPANLVLNPVQTNQINISWSVSSGATGYIVNRGGNPVGTAAGTSFSDTGLTANTYYCYSVVASNSIGYSTPTATVCTNSLAGAPTNYPPFVMDGAADSAGYLLASNTMTLYAAVRGTKLYVATWSPGTSGSNDHFIFVSDQLLPSASTAAPWAKAGKVAVGASKPFLASESLNTYIAWANAPAGSVAFKASSSSGQMEGVIDLAAAFGSVPANIYLCAAAYQTADGGALVAQAPAGTGPDIDTNEFLVIPVQALQDNNADGTFDRLDPAMGFVLQSAQRAQAGFAVTWAAMPGHSYQVVSADVLGNAWSNLLGAVTTAGPLQLYLSYTEAAPAAVTQRFYRVKLLQ